MYKRLLPCDQKNIPAVCIIIYALGVFWSENPTATAALIEQTKQQQQQQKTKRYDFIHVRVCIDATLTTLVKY